MRRLLAVLMLAGIAVPALAQPPAVIEQRWQDAQARYRAETDRYYAERDRYYASRGRPRGYQGTGGYGAPPPPPGDDRYDPNFDASQHYRDGNQYQERALAADDRVYAGSDGRYYCRRSDGTTGLIIGAAGGGVLGNVIDGGHSRTAGTLIGAAIGAIAGKSIDQNNSNIRCR